MQIIRTAVWVVLLVALLAFSFNNWNPVEVKIWGGMVLETKVPALVIVSFLVGIMPMWLLHRGTRWQQSRRINSLEKVLRDAAAVAATAQANAQNAAAEAKLADEASEPAPTPPAQPPSPPLPPQA